MQYISAYQLFEVYALSSGPNLKVKCFPSEIEIERSLDVVWELFIDELNDY